MRNGFEVLLKPGYNSPPHQLESDSDYILDSKTVDGKEISNELAQKVEFIRSSVETDLTNQAKENYLKLAKVFLRISSNL